MPRPSRSHRRISIALALLLLACTSIALLRWRPLAVRKASDPLASEVGRVPSAALPRKSDGSPETALEAAATDWLLDPHRREGPISSRHVLPAASVAAQPDFDPAIADPPSIPVIPLPPLPPADGSDHRPDRHPEADEPALEWRAPEEIRNLPWDTLRLEKPRWPESRSLRAYLQPLADNASAARWASDVENTLRQLEHRLLQADADHVTQTLEHLEFLAEQGQRMAGVVWPLRLRAAWLRAAYALERRVAVWKPIARLLQPAAPVVPVTHVSREASFERLGELQQMLSAQPQSESWYRYLRLADIEAALRGSRFQDLTERSALARSVLTRLHSPMLSPEQLKFLQSPPFQGLESVLRSWVTEPIDYAQLLRDMEQYELQRSSAEARRIAAAAQIARWSNQPLLQELGEQLSQHYRNANMRVAVAAELITPLLPSPPPVQETVDDHIAGAQICGRSRATGRLRIFLVPDRRHWRLGLESHGVVESETESRRGPARFFHDTNGRFRAHKVLQVDHRGIRVWSSVVDAEASPNLTGLETDFDSVPLLNVIARAIVMQQYEMEEGNARSLMRRRMRERIASRFDAEIEKSLRELKEQFTTRFQQPMRKLQLNPTPIELETTSTRLIARYRIAGEHQLASHTPRPQAPGDSVLSLQIHETTVNNILEQLHLDGRSVELKELYREMGRLFQGKEPEIPEDVPDGVQLKFAPQDAIRVQFGHDEITVVLALEKLSHKKRAWRHFVVRATYRPHPQHLDPTLQRVGYVRLKGRRLKVGDQVVLRGIFSKVFSRKPPVHFLGTKLAQDPRFEPFDISQYVVRGGWVGIALSPRERGRVPQDMARSPEELDLR